VLQSVILVYSDLASRRAAMASFGYAPNLPYSPIDPLAELARGHAAATRFADDLAAPKSQAKSAPPAVAVPSNSRDVAETLLFIQYVDKLNSGCDSRGGAVVTQLPTLDGIPTPFPGDPAEGPSRDGHIGGIEFIAQFRADGTWRVEIVAC
jgi:hypothetical protein